MWGRGPLDRMGTGIIRQDAHIAHGAKVEWMPQMSFIELLPHKTIRHALALLFGGVSVMMAGVVGVRAETLESALIHAYENNPQLNAQRASVRATDEAVPQALSGYRPKVNLSGSVGTQFSDTLVKSNTAAGPVYSRLRGQNTPHSVGVTVNQTLYNGQQTANRTRSAESQVSAAREALRVLEQTVLLSAATVYMDYLRDSAIVEVQRSNVRVLEETLRQTRERFNVGEVTKTDVAQSEAFARTGHRTGDDRKSQRDGGHARHRRGVLAGQDQRGCAVSHGQPRRLGEPGL